MTRSKKAIFAGFLSAAMVAQSVSAFAAEAGGEYLPDLQTQNQEVVSETAGESSPAAETAPEETVAPETVVQTEENSVTTQEASVEKKTFTDAEIAANDGVIYLANCGSSDTSVTPSGSKRGLYQGNVDQAYDTDASTGYNWGYVEDATYSATARGGDTTLKGSYRYQSDKITYEAGKSGIEYQFEVPEGDYKVTVGIDNPWSKWGTKKEDIILEGQKVESGLTAKDFEKEYEVTVTDGTLNVFVQSTSRSSTSDDPVLNYIVVKTETGEADQLEVLANVIKNYTEKTEGKTYKKATKEAFDQAIADAQKLVDEKSTDTDAIKAAKEAIETAFDALVETHIETYTSITGTDAARIYDDNGEAIQAHGGQVQKIGDTYYWLGEDRTNGYRPMPGVHLYSSKDLYNWKDEGVVLRTMDNYEQFETDDYFKKLYGDLTEAEKKDIYVDLWAEGCVMERPKMLYNEKTGKYVIWFHADGTSPYASGSGSNYAKAKAGIAIADSVNGPYRLLGSYMLTGDYSNHGFDSVSGHVRDMNLFKDDDGTAYVMYSSEGNAVMYIAKLNDEYTGLAKDASEMKLGEDFCISSTDSREGPAMFKYRGKYYLITSGCTGWAPNQAAYSVADSPLGPWKRMGDPCVGDTSKTTFDTQSTCVIPVDAENGKFIYMGDRWYNPDNGKDLSDSRYVWLPIEFGSGDTIMLKNYSNWTLDELEGKGNINVTTKLPETAESVSKLQSALPSTINVEIGGKAYNNQTVTWIINDADSLGEYPLGEVTVTGTLADLNREITTKVFCCPKGLTYFADCYTNGDNTSSVFEKFAAAANNLKNTVSDQKYGKDVDVNWGYTSTPGASGGSSSEDMGSKGSGDFFNTGWWATSGHTIEYGFELDPGNYVVSTGFNEWWSSTRGIKVTVSSVDADGNKTELGTGSASLSSSKTQDRNEVAVTVPEGSDHILVTISKASGSDPVLSWIGIIDTEAKAPEVKNLLTNGSFENGTEGWSLGNGAAIEEDSEAPDGTHYLHDNGNKNSWGDGSSNDKTNYPISVEPDTEYVLTGSIKVSGSGCYWAGARVAGKEIYCVAATDSSYTDTTDTDSKLAAAVKPGATEWTPFEIRFTTPSDVTTLDVYTWADNGIQGYLDNLVLTPVSSDLDWTAFDKAVEDADSLQAADYKEASWAEFQAVVEEAKAFKKNATEATKQREIRLMIKKLEEAKEALIPVNDPDGNTTYYVDAENGNDANDGTTPETAWKTLTKASSIRKMTEGGSILLKAGCVWNGEQLEVRNAEGTAENPIVIGSYGEGAKPVINGQGAPWDADSKEELAAVHIYNSENIVVENLEITNWDSSVSGDYTQSSKLLSGLVVENQDKGDLANVTVRNNKIHDVNGKMAGGADKAAGGLIVVVTGSGSNHTGTVESKYSNLTIEGNEVYRVSHEAIYMESVWASRTLVGGTSSDTGYQNAGNSKWIGSSNVVINSNYVHDVAGDGIVPINTSEAIVEYNLIDNSADTNWNYSGNPNHAALWAWDSDNVTFRYNEACNTSKAGWNLGISGTNDSMAFDFDYGVQNCLYEYNYSHDNYGGFLMLCPGPGATVNNIARYNVSVNDGLYDGAPMIRLGGGKYGSNGVQIYNNTMYWADSSYSVALTPTSNWEGSIVKDVTVSNNIFYGPAKADSVKTDGVTYSHNLVYGGAQDVYTATVNDDTTVVADPLFVNVKDYTSGTWENGKTTLGTAEGFKLQAGSPAIDAGAAHEDAPAVQPDSVKSELVANTNEKPSRDYYGTKLTDGKIDIGANEYKEAEPQPEPVDKSELQKLYDENSGKEQGNYTDDSWNTFTTALEAAKAVLDNADATAEQVAAATTALEEAVKGLTEKAPGPVQADKSELQKLYDENSQKEQGNYTDESWKAFETALESAKAVLDNEGATEEMVQAATEALKAAVDGLTEKTVDPTPADKTELGKLIKNAEAISADDYTAESYKELQDVLTAVKVIYDKDDAEQEEVDKAVLQLKAALDALQKPVSTPEKVDRSDLQKLYDQSLEKVEKDYTTATWKALKDAQAAVNKVLADKNATEEEISAAYKSLAQALDGLKKVNTMQPTTDNKNTGNKTTTSANGGNKTISGQTSAIRNAKTGDTTQIAIYVIGVLCAIIVFAGLVIARRKRNR